MKEQRAEKEKEEEAAGKRSIGLGPQEEVHNPHMIIARMFAWSLFAWSMELVRMEHGRMEHGRGAGDRRGGREEEDVGEEDSGALEKNGNTECKHEKLPGVLPAGGTPHPANLRRRDRDSVSLVL